MLRYKRPAEPAQFATTVAPFKSTIAKRIDVLMKKAAKQTASKKRRKTTTKKAVRTKKAAIKFANAWKKYKDIFSYVQFGKCGFCESDVVKTGYGDVEHYYPKGEIWALSDDTGRRSKKVLSEMGYWWLAYEWTNYLFACPKCNQTYKGSYFPVRQQKTRRLPPNQRPTKKFPKETPLLLNPYDRLDPANHLQFSSSGLVENRNRSRFGYETIRTCGLNRGQLVKAREDKAVRVRDLIEELAQGNNTRNWRTLKDIYFLGRDSAEHAAMVRDILKGFGLDWDVLVRRFAEEICRQLKMPKAVHASVLESYLEEMGRERYESWKMVRDIFEKSSKSKWKSLVQKRAEQLVSELLDSQKKSDTAHINLLETRFYEMGRESPSSLTTVANIYETRTGQTWADLEQVVNKRSTF